MEERFLVHHSPPNTDAARIQQFGRKGLAFAYARRKLPTDRNGGIEIERQVGNGADWQPTDIWNVTSDGAMDHRRVARKDT